MIYEDRKQDLIEKKAKKTMRQVFLPKDIVTSILQTIPYEYPKRKINVELTTDEFTCLCPFSGLPDFARITVNYVPRKKLIELKSFKYYLYSYRNVRIYNEHATNKILEDLRKVISPREITVIGEFTVRGGAKNKITAHYHSHR
ncbi:MAG: preQ(1) synthase [Candidatus Omnitrophota bacterium]|nr:preQ(1) synthase [Candidatus Omnitrophota bacterium]